MPKTVDTDAIRRAIASETASRGPLSQSELARRLGVSQATISRILDGTSRALRLGRGRGSRFVFTREVAGVGSAVAVFRVDQSGRLVADGTLSPVFDHGFAWTWADGSAKYFEGWPYLLEPLRPSGFLGRHVPTAHPELSLPTRLEDWSDDHVLRYATALGWNMPGDRIVGTSAQRSFLRASGLRLSTPASERMRLYAQRVDDLLGADAGSSAGGEQPKFLSMVDGRACIVKFSPDLSRGDAVARRWADLLVCEHLALQTLKTLGVPASTSRIFIDDARTFLEIERFDRVGHHGRRAVLPLRVLQAEFVDAPGEDWVSVARDLERQGLAPLGATSRLATQQAFGRLIGNTDMHLGNVSVFLDGRSITDTTPAYDMLPMLWAPVAGDLPNRTFDPLPPASHEFEIFSDVLDAALRFWAQVVDDERISGEVRDIAQSNSARLKELQTLIPRLPSRELET
ncbi:MAG: HipA domain-containing protein [Myxococcota bacterium]